MHRTRTGGRGVLHALIADRQPLWQNALGATLLGLGFGAVTVCDAWDELEQLASHTRPHLVLVDPEGFPGLVEEDVCAVGFAPVIVVSAREQAANGRAFVSKCGTAREIERGLREAIAAHEWATLTKRELEILRLVADGLSNRQVARALWLSDQTVKFHLAHAYRKLGVGDRRAAVDRVRRFGLLPEQTVQPVTPVSAEVP